MKRKILISLFVLCTFIFSMNYLKAANQCQYDDVLSADGSTCTYTATVKTWRCSKAVATGNYEGTCNCGLGGNNSTVVAGTVSCGNDSSCNAACVNADFTHAVGGTCTAQYEVVYKTYTAGEDGLYYENSENCGSGYSGASPLTWACRSTSHTGPDSNHKCTYSSTVIDTSSICNNGQYYDDSTSSCKTCPSAYPNSTKGTNGSISRCYKECPAGQYHNGTGCVACPTGTYKASASTWYYNNHGEASTSCTACPTGQTTSGTGKTSVNDCYTPSGSTTYKVTADANGGTITTTSGWTNASDNKTATKNVNSGSKYGTLPTVTRTNYTLKEWNTKADGTGTKVTSDTTASATATIYAIWDSSTVSVTGLTVSPKTSEINIGGFVQLTATITPDNATNKTVNWSSSDPTIATVDNTGKVTGVKVGTVTITATTQDGSKSDTAQVTVKAAGEDTNTHNIIFDCNGGSGTMTPMSVVFGNTITLTANACTRNGYTFKEWKGYVGDTPIENGTYQDKASIDYTFESDIILKAQWTRNSNTYLVHYDANGGSGSMADTEATYGVSGTLRANAFKYSGHTFDGWKAYYVDSNGNWTPLKDSSNKEVEFKNKATFVDLYGPNDEEVTLYAQWKVVNPKTGIFVPTMIIGGLLLVSSLGYYLVKKKNIVLE